jgi:alkylation response protein AidB-like acyl-CoA dehydrogenase
MTQTDNIILDTANRIFIDLSTPEVINAAERGEWPTQLWQAVEEAGLNLTWVPELNGGVGASALDGFGVIKAAGANALPVPLAETLMAGWLLAKAGLAVPAGPLSVACGDLNWADGVLTGVAPVVPFARVAAHLVAVAQVGERHHVLLVAAGQYQIAEHGSLSGEPWDSVTFSKAKPIASGMVAIAADADVEALGALVRATQAAGALSTALELTIQYATERVQFGRAIGKFQAIQHMIAEFAGEVAAINAAADAAAEAFAHADGIDDRAWVEIATAKTRLGEAVSKGAAIAHQVHGAMGFTYEHRLHHFTRRLWAWRDEFGTETEWARRLGQTVLGWGAEGLWPAITAVSSAENAAE